MSVEQLELEQQYSNESIARTQRSLLDSFERGRAADTGPARRIVSSLFEEATKAIEDMLNERTAGLGGKYRSLIRIVKPDILAVVAIRTVIRATGLALGEQTPQDVLQQLGKTLESEVYVQYVLMKNPVYLEMTVKDLVKRRVKDVTVINRSYSKALQECVPEYEPWSTEYRLGVARIVLAALYPLEFFEWRKGTNTRNQVIHAAYLTPQMQAILDPMVTEFNCRMIYPPMIVPPKPWTAFDDGGYLSEGLQVRAPMVGFRGMPSKYREWVKEELSKPVADPMRAAMSKAQSVAYRINVPVLNCVQAIMDGNMGILGLPLRDGPPRPEFPMHEDWDKADGTESELRQFEDWCGKMRDWYTIGKTRIGMVKGLSNKIKYLRTYQGRSKLWFPMYADWRGRGYFRPSVNMQDCDAIKACYEFADGKPLTERGAFWLKVHVANCCGFDKHLPEIKAQWTDDNWEMILDFIDNPLAVQPPENDTAFTLLQAGIALRDYMNDTTTLVHVPVAMDATCSGLQHLSAMLRDPIGAAHTNLVYNGMDQKSDIYGYVASIADKLKLSEDIDAVVKSYWSEFPIPRSMAKGPVMTYVYGSTLQSTMDYVVADMVSRDMEPILDTDGKVLFSLRRLGVVVAKTLRTGVREAVPAADEAMRYIIKLARHCVDIDGQPTPMRWISPIGMPVVGWVDVMVEKQLAVRSMGLAALLLRFPTGVFDRSKALSGINPNVVHSLDSAHLWAVINRCDFPILPIHDSFACHPNDVDDMHLAIRQTFLELYEERGLGMLLELNNFSTTMDCERPVIGDFDLKNVLNSPFMFC